MIQEQVSSTGHVTGKLRFRRSEAAEYLLSVHGVRVSPATLAKWATLGGGPRFAKFNRWPLYPREELDAWVRRKLGDLVESTSADRR